MAQGVLKRGFVIHNHMMKIKLAKGTKVKFFSQNQVPTVFFEGIPVMLMRNGEGWIAEVYGVPMQVQFPEGGSLPYPLSYFK